MKKILAITAILLLSSTSHAKETLSIATGVYFKGLAYNDINPSEKSSYLGFNMSAFINKAACKTVDLTPNPKTGNLEWKTEGASQTDGSWYGPTHLEYDLTIRKEANGEFYLYSKIKFNGVTTTSGSREVSKFVTLLTGSTEKAGLQQAGKLNKIDLIPVLVVKSCK